MPDNFISFLKLNYGSRYVSVCLYYFRDCSKSNSSQYGKQRRPRRLLLRWEWPPNLGPALQPSLGPAPQPSLGPVPQPSLGPAPQPSLGPAPQPSLGSAPQPSLGPAPQPSLGPAPQKTS
uniref:Signal transducer and activator of transcription 2 n=1 Tax=Cacopsylla melanoneura TaxID=428564 RepID=A0A8D8Y313_9HEMI